MWRVEKAIAGFRRSGDRADDTPPRSRGLPEAQPVSEDELDRVAHEYRRVRAEHHRAPPQSKTRRRLDARLEELRDRFERLLAEAPAGERDRRRRQAELVLGPDHTSPHVDVEPLLFRGTSAAGSELRLVAGGAGTIDALVDGTTVAVLDDAKELTATTPPFVFTLDGIDFHETFGASRSGLAELRDAFETARLPSAAHLLELVEDGLVDGTFGLTPRGRRALDLDHAPARRSESAIRPEVTLRGDVRHGARDGLVRALDHVVRLSPRPVLRATASLLKHEDPALERPFEAKAAIEMAGRVVRVHATAPTETETIDLLASRLGRSLRNVADREISARRRGGGG